MPRFNFHYFTILFTLKPKNKDENLRKVRVTGISSPTFVRSPIDMIRNKIYVFHFIVAAYLPATILLNKYFNEIHFQKNIYQSYISFSIKSDSQTLVEEKRETQFNTSIKC